VFEAGAEQPTKAKHSASNRTVSLPKTVFFIDTTPYNQFMRAGKAFYSVISISFLG
jgi:hypothetical protein